jgi:hypothetical protein
MDKIIFVFNKFYTSLIKDVKKNTNDEIKNIIRKHYKAIDNLSHEYIEFFIESFDNSYTNDMSILEDKEIFKTIKIGSILPVIVEDDDKLVFWNYYYILAVLALVYIEYKELVSDATASVDILAQSVLNILTKKQKGEDVTDDISVILHDDVQLMLTKIKSVVLVTEGSAGATGATGAKGATGATGAKGETSDGAAPNPFANIFKGMENSKICNLAQEISNDIDVSKLNIETPDDIMKLLDFSSSNNIMGDIIKKVSSKMHEKISNGELKQEDLFGEAVSMMGKMSSGATAGGKSSGAKTSGGSGGAADPFAGLASMMSGLSGAGGAGGLASMMSGLSGAGGGGGGGGAPDIVSMMGGLMNNPMMAEMLKAAKKGKVATNTEALKGASSRDRLRKKLEERKNKN